MPEELLKVSYPVRIVTEEARNAEIAAYEAKVNNGETVFGHSFDITQEMSDDYINRFGTNNWYDWALANWGTKWGGYDAERMNPDTVRFLTAWSTPFEAIVTLSKLHPDHEFVVQFADEDFGSNVGEYVIMDGECIYENRPASCSKGALDLAREILGYDPHEEDEEYEDEDSEN